jgi:N-acyl-phosphatidylethanolamine-hydrolysing phospholipase D
LWASWAVTSPKRRIYYAGDSGYFPGFTEIGHQLGPFDLAIVPIGAYAPRAMMLESHMNPEEALQSATDVGASKALGVHFGTFDLSDEPLAEPPKRFLNASSNAPAAAPTPWIFKVGETRRF